MKTIERKAIKGCTNFEIDTNGKVWNTTTRQSVREYVNPAGFSYVVINGRIRTIAYLMKAAFFTDDSNICIRHKDGDRTNNKLSNLYTLFDGSETLNTKGEEKNIMVMEINPQTNEVIRLWNTLTEAAKHYGEDSAKIRYAQQHGKVINGRKFEIYNAALDGLGLFDYTDGNHKLCIYNELGKLLKKVDTIVDAERYTGDNAGAINKLVDMFAVSENGYRYKWQLSTSPEKVENKKCKGGESIAVCQYSLNGELITTYPSLAAAARASNAQSGSISMAINGKKRSVGGCVWRREGDAVDKYPLPKSHKKMERVAQRIDVYDLNGKFIGNYATISEAARVLNVNVGGLQKCLSGSAGRVGNYVARKEGEAFNKYKHSQSKIFYQMKPAEDGNGFIITREWQSVSQGCKELGYTSGAMSGYLHDTRQKKRPYKDGYYYAYGSY